MGLANFLDLQKNKKNLKKYIFRHFYLFFLIIFSIKKNKKNEKKLPGAPNIAYLSAKNTFFINLYF